MLLIDCEIGPVVQDVEQRFSDQRLRNGARAEPSIERDGVLVLLDARRFQLEFAL